MVRENILEFERKHSKNLTELNEWVEKVKSKERRDPESEPIAIPDPFWDKSEPVLLEESDLYKETGKLWDSDPLYKNINTSSLEDMAHLKVISKYLTKEELKERLIYENYMLLETEKVMDEYLLHLEDKKTMDRIARLKAALKETEAKLKKPTMDDKVEEILVNMNKRAGTI